MVEDSDESETFMVYPPEVERPFSLSLEQVENLPMTFDELLELPRRLHAARQAWKLAEKLYDEGILSYEEKIAVRAGVRAILGLPVDE